MQYYNKYDAFYTIYCMIKIPKFGADLTKTKGEICSAITDSEHT